MSLEDSPARMLYTHLWSYLRGNVAYVSLDFNFGTEESLLSYDRRLNTVLDRLEIGDLKE